MTEQARQLLELFDRGPGMRRYIVTGAPGSGKTVTIRELELDGFSIVDEAATDLIAALQARGIQEPWTHRSFIDQLAALQRDRQIRASFEPVHVQFHDRSAVCTAALANYLGYPVSPLLAAELRRIKVSAIYQQRVFFLRNLGFITNTDARRITYEETLRFEKIHEETYRELGFELIYVEPGSIMDRTNRIKTLIGSPSRAAD
jgi:predicted ATPase